MQILYVEPKNIWECPVCKKEISGFILHEDEVWRCPRCDSRAQEFTIIQATVDLDLNDDCSPEMEATRENIQLIAEKQKSWFDSRTDMMMKATGAYVVSVESMIATLEQTHPETAQWYQENFPNPDEHVVFRESDVEEISPMTIVMSSRELESEFHDMITMETEVDFF